VWRALVVSLLAVAAALLAARADAATRAPALVLPQGITARELALVVNDADPASVELAEHYARARGIAAEQVLHVSFPPGRAVLDVEEFGRIKAQVDAATPDRVQAYALAWTEPYRVECMSITAAFAFGFDRAHCADGCRLTQPSPYFDSDSAAPHRDLGMRPTMLLAAPNLAEAKALVDRGVRADAQWPQGTAYLVQTSDAQRSVRTAQYERARELLRAAYPIEQVKADAIEGRADVMFYFTGLARVPRIQTNRFLDGAIADHLTSAGGVLLGSGQTSALEWIHAGATGSYGTALEPCNFAQKFPAVPVVMGRYLAGETLIEAYWKSVRMPGQGVFVGEPLARPFGGVRRRVVGTTVEFRMRALRPGRYRLQAATSAVGPFRGVATLQFDRFGPQTLRLPATPPLTYRLVPAGPGAG
jgi:uncharacterized protein (TIGR03790 family)